MNLRVIVAFVALCCWSWTSFATNIKIQDDKHEILNNLINGGSTFRAGVAKINGTLPVGTPLAGYNHDERRVPFWPLPEFGQYTTWMTGSKGNLNPTWVKALVIDNVEMQFAFVTLDGIGSDSNLNQLAWLLASVAGFPIPMENCLFSSSHTHSGPGAVSSDMLWALAPATDLMVPSLRKQLAQSMADAMLQAYSELAPAQIGVGMGNLVGVTQNRRAGKSPYVKKGTIDPHLGVISIDSLISGKPVPLATVWNFAVHGVCYGPENMYFSSDIMGGVCDNIEEMVGGVALFINGDAGDIDPTDKVCEGKPNFAGGPIIAQVVQNVRNSLKPSTVVDMKLANNIIDFGPTDLNITLQRWDNCTQGGPLDICTFCTWFRCDLNPHLPEAWIEQTPRFLALSLSIGGESTVIVSIPGEALVELGWWIRNDTQALGFDNTFLAGYSNNHMGYFATPNEYDIGGYESQLTFWGISTADQIRQGCKSVAKQVVPDKKK